MMKGLGQKKPTYKVASGGGGWGTIGRPNAKPQAAAKGGGEKGVKGMFGAMMLESDSDSDSD